MEMLESSKVGKEEHKQIEKTSSESDVLVGDKKDNKIFIKVLKKYYQKHTLLYLFSLTIIFLVFVLSLLFAIIYNNSKKSNRNPNVVDNQRSTYSSQYPTSSPTHVVIPTTDPYARKNYVLQKIDGDSVKDVLSFCADCGQIYIEKWGNWLLYDDFVPNKSFFIVYAYNFATGEKKTIFDPNENKTIFENDIPLTDFDQLKVIGNTLYFSYGGYLRTGAVFWMDLPPSGDVHKLADNRNARIVEWHGRDWLIGGEGDACWGVTEYSLVDLVNKKVTKVATSTVGCYDGEMFIGINRDDRMILAYHESNPNSGYDYIDNPDDNYVFKYVIAVPLSNPSEKEGVIAKQDMPDGIKDVIYSPDDNRLYLVGDQNYVYDFSTKKIEKTDSVPQVESDQPNLNYGDKLDETIKSLSLPPSYKFVKE